MLKTTKNIISKTKFKNYISRKHKGKLHNDETIISGYKSLLTENFLGTLTKLKICLFINQ